MGSTEHIGGIETRNRQPRLEDAWNELVRPVAAFPRKTMPGREKAHAAKARGGQPLDVESLRLIETFGDVDLLRGWDHSLERPVMIRALTAEAAASPMRREQFWAGAKLQAQLRHERLVGVHVLDESKNLLVTECAKHSLTHELRKGALPATRVRLYLDQALEGLAYLHQQGQIHGQLQPDALLVDDCGNLKIDRPLGVQPDGEFLYRPGLEKYTAPETLDETRFGPVGPTVDLYSLGMTVLELLAGEKLAELVLPGDVDFTDVATSWQKWHVSAAATLPPVLELLPKTPPRLARVIDRLIAKRVCDRFASAEEAWSELNHAAPRIDEVEQPASRDAIGRGALVVQRRAAPAPFASAMAVQSVAYGRPRPLTSERRPLTAWAQKITDERTSNAAAVGVLLMAVLVAGLLFATGGETTEIPVLRDRLVTEEAIVAPRVSVPVPEPPKPESVEMVAITAPPIAAARVPLPPRDGTLEVQATPPTAVILIDGVEVPWNVRPVKSLRPGKHTVEVRQWDCHRSKRSVVVAAGDHHVVTMKLDPAPERPRYEPVPPLNSRTSPAAAEFIGTVLEDLWWDAKVARNRSSKIMAKVFLHDPQLLEKNPWAAHAAALWDLRMNNKERATIRFEIAAGLAPGWYSAPRKYVIRHRLLEGDYHGVREQCDWLARAFADSTNGASNAPLVNEFRRDTGYFLGLVSGLLTGPCVEPAGLPHVGSCLDEEATASFQAAQSRVLDHFRELSRRNGASVNARGLIEQHLPDTVVGQREMLLRALRERSPALAAPASEGVRGSDARLLGSIDPSDHGNQKSRLKARNHEQQL